jgi:hypothetical protein
LLGLLLFNWIGYRLVSDVMALKASENLEAALDQDNYDESSLIEMRVPLHLPYQNNWSDFERFNGEIEIAGVHYKYVKRKVERGELVVMCIPNEKRTKIESSRDDYFMLMNDLDQDAQATKSGTSAFKGFFSEYRDQLNDWSLAAPARDDIKNFSFNTTLFNSFNQQIPGQPPEFSSLHVG